ncbi:bifunctional protein FolD [Polymorphobacter multimanifer]|uniref:bifunctional methylenetetrahydrofolate dehydrogenase/methenyltetrahydrofolate cyclohydrolase FolD n=1 Tax=Polymorphobacter multimanifer TaxID=1070431 RepID=UPI001666028E|nr:bifunctional methylenetetrahydrofolate dehydrogenase/methenyltetrahydrofolate cyclohydrolase FolD [Polymorphobacter multimanifer]GGI82793.1 bifunctional protein FolD [Polymorphobacter multimanifer]
MSAILIDGKARAARLRAEVALGVAEIVSVRGRAPGLAVVLVGEDPASSVYVRNKGVATREAGMVSVEHKLPADVGGDALLALVATLNADDAVDGILVQLPLPRHIDADKVIAALDPAKDVDGFHPVNAGRLMIGQPALVPCTPKGCLMLIEEALGDLSGREALVIGRSSIVGKPMAALLTAKSATVTVAHSRTRDLAGHVARAEIVVAAVGIPAMVQGEWLRPGACVIDVGINRVVGADGKGRLVGDVDFASALPRAGWITPVPGGVGPMTIACLLANTLQAARARA